MFTRIKRKAIAFAFCGYTVYNFYTFAHYIIICNTLGYYIMEITKRSIEDLLNNLVKPMFNGIIKIEVVSLSLFDGIGSELYPVIDVIFDKELFFAVDDTNELENKVSREVRLTLRYFNIHNSIVDVYVMSD